MKSATRFGIGTFASAMVLLALAALPGAAAPKTRPAADANAAEFAKWDRAITFFGEEDTGIFSIRALDRFVTEPANFKYLELWIYDVNEKKWIKVDDRVQTARIILPKDKPADSPDNQLLAEIPVTSEKIGLYFAKWQVNDIVNGFTMTRIGPGPVGKPVDLGKVPDGMMIADVPLDKNHGERMIIPNPPRATGEPGK